MRGPISLDTNEEPAGCQLQRLGTSVPQRSGVSAEDGCPRYVCRQRTARPAGTSPPGLCHRRGCPAQPPPPDPCPTHRAWPAATSRRSAGKRPGRAAPDPGPGPDNAGAPAPAPCSCPADAGPGGSHRSPGLSFASRPCRPGRVESRSRQGRPECRSLSDPCGAGPSRARPPAATGTAGLGRARRGCGWCVHGGRDRAGQRGAEGGDNPVVAVTWSR